MKKIICLALTFVMACAMCVTAFAATEYSVMDMTNTVVATATDLAAQDTHTYITNGTTTFKVVPKTYTIGGKTYYVCDSSIAERKIVKNGAVVDFITSLDASAGITKKVTAVITVKDTDKRTCGDYNCNVVVIDGKVYEATGANLALYNDKMVTYGAEVTPIQHILTITKVVNNKATTAECSKCKTVFETMEKVPADYTGKVMTVVYNGITYYVKVGSNSTVVPEKANVTSAKTFDAGIEIYAAMMMTTAAGAIFATKKKH